MLSVQNISFEIQNQKLLSDISFELKKGSFTGIIGPNGAGKSTLLKNIYGSYTPNLGKIMLDGVDIDCFSPKEFAKKVAVLPQENSVLFNFDVEEVVLMGRSMYHGIFETKNKKDQEIAENSLRKVGMLDFKHREYNTLSGGEKQRVLLARALTQQTDFLILDEPSNHLDIGHQFSIFELLASLKKTILVAVHDLNLAARFCEDLILLEQGRIIAHGRPNEVLTKMRLEKIFDVECNIREEDNRFTIDYLNSVKRFNQ